MKALEKLHGYWLAIALALLPLILVGCAKDSGIRETVQHYGSALVRSGVLEQSAAVAANAVDSGQSPSAVAISVLVSNALLALWNARQGKRIRTLEVSRNGS